MAMIKCPECGRMISDRASMCIGCGISKEDIEDMLATDGKKKAGENSQANSSNMQKKTAVCPACGYPHPDGQGICSNCGISLWSVTGMTHCQNCGRKISVFAPLCPGCWTSRQSVLILLSEVEGKADAGTEHKTVFRSKKLRCAICKTEYNPSVNRKCPGCSYPALTFCNKTPAMQEFVKGYRKKAGIQTVKLQVGQSYKMGRYGGEDISWRVLATEPGKALLISEKGLAAKPYNETRKSITWAECTLRKWLNTYFMLQAFNNAERTRIMHTKLQAEKNPAYSSNPVQDTTDQIFLLSIPEAEKYFKDKNDRKAFPTEYAKRNGAYVDDRTNCCWWWLRSSGYNSDSTAGVRNVGEVSYMGNPATYEGACVRPALWIDLEF